MSAIGPSRTFAPSPHWAALGRIPDLRLTKREARSSLPQRCCALWIGLEFSPCDAPNSEPVGVPPTRGGQPSAFRQNDIIPMPQPRHGLRQIGCGNQWHQRSAGTADVPTPDDLGWPRRAIVGAIVVIGMPEAPGVFQPRPRSIAAIRKDRPKAVLQSNVPGQNSFGIKPCPARSDRQPTTIPGRSLTIKISVLK